MNSSKNKLSGIIFALFVIVAIAIVGTQLFKDVNLSRILNTRPAVEISIIYAPESEAYLPEAINNFNESYDRGINPVTGKPLEQDEKRIIVTGKNSSSGTVKDQVVNALLNRSGEKAKPTIFAPSVGDWLYLVNYETSREVFKSENITATANAPVVMAIWESRLNLLKAKYGNDIGWEELLTVLNSPNGWRDLTTNPDIRKRVYYGHTDPRISSTALSTLIMEYFASAKLDANNKNLDQLTLTDVQKASVQKKVKDIEQLIRHYSSRTTEFKQYIAQGPDYLDFVALEENDLIYINQGKTEYKPPEKLVALYPKEGTFNHEHPFGIVTADWVSEEQTTAAKQFTQYVLTDVVQQKVMENGFRPVSQTVQLGYPIVSDLGVDPAQPSKILKTPSPQVIATVQEGWDLVKKKSDVIMLVDTSGSMDGPKMENAKKAIKTFSEKISPASRIALTSFSNVMTKNVPLDSTENNRNKMTIAINELDASGSTALYDSLASMIDELAKDTDQTTIKAIIVLSDGEDTASTLKLSDITAKLNALHKDGSSILIIPVAYGADADTRSLEAIARASKTVLQQGDTKDINKLLETISSYF